MEIANFLNGWFFISAYWKRFLGAEIRLLQPGARSLRNFAGEGRDSKSLSYLKEALRVDGFFKEK